MPDVAAIQLALSELQDDLAEQNRRIAEQNVLLAEQNSKLGEVEEKLPTFVPRSRLTGILAIVVAFLVLLIAVAIVVTSAIRHSDNRQLEDNQRRDRITAAARGYSNCVGINRALEAVDVGYSALAAQAHANDETPEEHEATDRAHALLRSGLARSDCDSLLASLSPADAEAVRAESSTTLPTLPLPPPPTLGRQ